MDKLTLTQAIEGYLLAASARRLSWHTIRDYSTTFRKLLDFLGSDPLIDKITPREVEAFLASRDEVSKKTLLNYHTGLSALWTWCLEEQLVTEQILNRVRRPKPEKKDIIPYSQAEVKVMLDALTHSRSYTRPGKRQCANTLWLTDRNRAIIYLLLDTGIRADELSTLHIYDLDLRNTRITVMGKGSKQRSVPFSSRTGQVLWRYMAKRKDDHTDDYLFVTHEGRRVTASELLHLLVRIGVRAGVRKVNCHRFRHTFAINYLRNGGDPYTLQMMLGHSTMEMVKRYLSISQADLDRNHKLASPVDNWRL